MKTKKIKKLAIAIGLLLLLGTAGLVKSAEPVNASSGAEFAKKFNLRLFTFPKKYRGTWKGESYNIKITKHAIDGTKVYKASTKVFREVLDNPAYDDYYYTTEIAQFVRTPDYPKLKSIYTTSPGAKRGGTYLIINRHGRQTLRSTDGFQVDYFTK